MEISNLQILADIIISGRENKGWSQRTLAKKCGLSNSEISMLENSNRKKPNLEVLKLISDALGENFSDMLEILGYIKDSDFGDQTNALTQEENDFINNTTKTADIKNDSMSFELKNISAHSKHLVELNVLIAKFCQIYDLLNDHNIKEIDVLFDYLIDKLRKE